MSPAASIVSDDQIDFTRNVADSATEKLVAKREVALQPARRHSLLVTAVKEESCGD